MHNAMSHHKNYPTPAVPRPRRISPKVHEDLQRYQQIPSNCRPPPKTRQAKVRALGAGTAPVKIGPSTQPKLSQTLSAQNTKMPTPLQPCPLSIKIPNLRTPTHYTTPRRYGGTFEVSVERRNGGTYEVSVERQTGGTFEVPGGNGGTVP